MADENTQTFLFDDYSSTSEGVEVIIPFRGKNMPFRIKRSLSLDEMQVANDAGVHITLGKDGQPEIESMNQSAYTKEIVLAALKSWPFVDEAGRPTPINRKTVHTLNGVLLQEIANKVLVSREVQETASGPFEMKSGEGS